MGPLTPQEALRRIRAYEKILPIFKEILKLTREKERLEKELRGYNEKDQTIL